MDLTTQVAWLGKTSGGGRKGDLVAERFELADVVALGALGVAVGVVEAGAQILETDLGGRPAGVRR